MSGLEAVIGLEVHVQLGCATKLFSDAPATFGGEPNSRVSPIDLGLPGVLPMPNEQAVRLAVRAALALGGEVQACSRFARKNYFYPDLPKGYQITQYDRPFCRGGRVPIAEDRWCRLHHVHLEEDAGKSTHAEQGSLVDLNRAGVALIEIVGEPDLRAPEEAHAFLEQLRRLLRYAGVSECDMEKGSLRCDANVSVRSPGAPELGTKVEIKNLNSMKMVQRALEYELRRQSAALAAGGTVVQETRLWNEERGETVTMRTKESAPDYRYFPEPDIPPLEIADELVEQERATMPELPAARRLRLRARYGLPHYDVEVLTEERELADYFEAVAGACGDAKAASNWTMTEVLRLRNETGDDLASLPVAPDALAALIRALAAGRVNHQAARKVFGHMAATGAGAEAAIAELRVEQIGDRSTLEPIVRRVVEGNAKAVADFRAGKGKALHALKGLVMRETRGRADPAAVDALLHALLQEP